MRHLPISLAVQVFRTVLSFIHIQYVYTHMYAHGAFDIYVYVYI